MPTLTRADMTARRDARLVRTRRLFSGDARHRCAVGQRAWAAASQDAAEETLELIDEDVVSERSPRAPMLSKALDDRRLHSGRKKAGPVVHAREQRSRLD